MLRSSLRLVALAAGTIALVAGLATPALAAADNPSDPTPCTTPRQVSVADAEVVEGSSPSAPASLTFVITSTGCLQYATLDYRTRLSRPEPDRLDFATTSDLDMVEGTLRLPAAGAATVLVTVAITGDDLDECHESLALSLFASSPAVNLTRGSATGRILDDDGLEVPVFVRGHCGD